MTLTALDDFAGTGWGVACQWLGIEEQGVELMDEAVASRDAAGMTTVARDVWAHLADTADAPLEHDLYIASPPCQTFSAAGKGAGRQALDTVLQLIEQRAYLDVDQLHAFGVAHDPRTALVLAPLVRIYRNLPERIVLEQVPPVLPVWERYAEELRRWGYSVATGIVNAEQYGVPQTRRRAILVARLDGEAKLPTPTHSRYYSRDPERLDEGVMPWVSAAEALGVADLPKWTHERPSTTIVGSFSPDVVSAPGGSGTRPTDVSRHRQDRPGSIKVTAEQAGVLQSYPADFPFQGAKAKKFLQIGNAVPPLLARAILSEAIS